MSKKQERSQLRTFRCRRCGSEFKGLYHDAFDSAQRGADDSHKHYDKIFGKGLLGSLAGAVVGAAVGATSAAALNYWEGRCPSCGGTDAELVPAYYTVADYSAVQRLVSAAWSKRTNKGERAFEECWAKAYEMAYLPREQHRMPFVEPRGESLATHRMVADELYGALTVARRAKIESAPDAQWLAIIRLRKIYESMRPDVRWAILNECTEATCGAIAAEDVRILRDESIDHQTLALLVEEFQAIDRESEEPIVERRAFDKFVMKARDFEILKGPLEQEGYWLLHYRLGMDEDAWREARQSGASTTTMATHRAAAEEIFPGLSAETRSRFAARRDVNWMLVLELRELYRKAKKRHRALLDTWVEEFVQGSPSEDAVREFGVREIDRASLEALLEELGRVDAENAAKR